MAKNYNLKLHRVLISELVLIREVDTSTRTKMFMKGLEDSISELGVLMPLLVMQQTRDDDKEYKFALIDGYKRLDVLKKINKSLLAVNVLIAEGSAENMSFSVNHVRGELSKLYQALYLHNIINKEKITQDELSKRFMLSKGEVSKLLSVVRHPSLVKMVKSGMTMTSAKSLAISVSSLTQDDREKQIVNVRNSFQCSEMPSRKFEKITNIMSEYIAKTKEPIDTRKIRKIYDYVEKNNNFVNSDRIIKSLMNNSTVDNYSLNPTKLINAVKTISETSGHNHLKYDINNNGTVTIKLKMNTDEFRQFKKMIGSLYISNNF
ncbi:MAG: ParB N-terminal domain-containing protein, partial [Candidatus Sericytochromatia bacterium]|nr:ParB N-terminal domain-containing protein [Candidatus Sericytochromatia bacterium]